MINSPVSIKEQRQTLLQKKEARLLQMVKLGEFVHHKVLENEYQQPELIEFSTQIINLDKEVYSLSKQIMEQTVSQEKCTQCQQPVTKDIKFCGNCGQLNAFYVDSQMPMKVCTTCNEEIEQKMQYCPCCGTQQGGI